MQSLVGTILEQYLGDYFSNFSKDKFNMSLLRGEISVHDLIFSDNLNKRLDFPFKLKYGQLGKLEIKIESGIFKGGLKMRATISDVLLCFEMLEMKQWSKETIISRYQEMKKHAMKAFEKALGIFTREFSNDKENQDGMSAQVESIIANLTIDIEQVYIRFEDEGLKFAIGILVPNLNCLSCDKNFSLSQWIDDPSVLYKKIAIDDISVFINTKDTFKPLAKQIYLTESLAERL